MFEHLLKPPAHIITEQVREWDYGEYEGLLSAEIREKNPNWDIWRDGCPGGESVEEMTTRIDGVISQVGSYIPKTSEDLLSGKQVREYHRKWKEEGEGPRDVVIVAHGHFNRCLIARWIKQPLCNGTFFNVEPAGIAILSYNHDSLAEPALNALNLNALG
ncbi:hypothetical protein EWM64_g9338 [Hericium alpestre]|uniref:Uncharacterized protein n=1 Tax=Hericium alpestre TaxID=135208 RepID=A0A4Y9ZJB1_9AGAM|nr:hypothetical protein EWM64_g9338 [Hericium alpestre]